MHPCNTSKVLGLQIVHNDLIKAPSCLGRSSKDSLQMSEDEPQHLSLAAGSMRLSTTSASTSAAAPAKPLEAPPSNATNTGTNLQTTTPYIRTHDADSRPHVCCHMLCIIAYHIQYVQEEGLEGPDEWHLSLATSPMSIQDT